MGLKNRLKEIRMREYMMSSKEFAKKLDVPLSTYSNWELCVSKPKLEEAFEIATKLNKKVDEIWYLE